MKRTTILLFSGYLPAALFLLSYGKHENQVSQQVATKVEPELTYRAAVTKSAMVIESDADHLSTKPTEPGESSVTFEGVVYPFDKKSSSGILKDEIKKEQKKGEKGKLEYHEVKTGKRILWLSFWDVKNGHHLTQSIYFDGNIGEKNSLNAGDQFGSKWAGKSLNGVHSGNINVTSIKKLEPYLYLMSGTFEKDMEPNPFGNTKKYHFKGQFKDFVIHDLQNPDDPMGTH
ncbi:hypothetical protein [Runella sp.]|uniref:hypothetical protein n=1 Tax=Runella sp. TaxID=1960881 RepID=UPI0030168F29